MCQYTHCLYCWKMNFLVVILNGNWTAVKTSRLFQKYLDILLPFFFLGHFTFSFYLCKVILNKSFSIPKTNTKFYVSYISTRKKKITTGVSYVWWLICRHSLVLRTKRRKECPSSASCQDPQIFRKMMVVIQRRG